MAYTEDYDMTILFIISKMAKVGWLTQEEAENAALYYIEKRSMDEREYQMAEAMKEVR